MSKPNLLRHPFGVSMTTFKLPDLASNGGNLLSKFICILRIRSCRDNRAQMRNVSTATVCDGATRRVALSVAFWRARIGGEMGRVAAPLTGFSLHTGFRFPKEIFSERRISALR